MDTHAEFLTDENNYLLVINYAYTNLQSLGQLEDYPAVDTPTDELPHVSNVKERSRSWIRDNWPATFFTANEKDLW